MTRKPITVRVIGDGGGIVSALDEARALCVRRALEPYEPQERGRILDLIAARYAPPDP